MKQWELRGVTVDRRGITASSATIPSAGAPGRPGTGRRPEVDTPPRGDAESADEVPASKR